MKKVKIGIIGTGNIGTDLLVKVQRSKVLECGIFAGRNFGSGGMKIAESLDVKTSDRSIRAIEDDPECCEIVFDATTAKAHLEHAPVLKKMGKYVIDLTPSQIGRMCVPVINMEQCLGEGNVNLVTCGGQAALPIIYSIMKVHPETRYVEMVASISSKSAGTGTRENIDEFTQTTRDAIRLLTGAPDAKAIIILNPAEPPLFMHSTIYAQIKDPRITELREVIGAMVKKIQEYVPGYKLILGPVPENGRLTVMVSVVGLGDYLPRYSGNLDIVTCAAVKIAEEYAKKKILKKTGRYE